MAAWLKTTKEEFLDPDEPYRMDLSELGHAFIVNNLANNPNMGDTMADVEELEKVYTKMGFNVHVKKNCDGKEMEEIKSEMMSEKLHADSNCFMLTILTHGDQFGNLADANGNLAWQIDHIKGLDRFFKMAPTKIVEGLNEVSTLVGKPKLLVIDACRGDKVTEGQTVPIRSLQPELEAVADKSDFYVAYATVPGYAAAGSHFAQSVARNLGRFYMTHSIDRIFTCVRRDMESITQNVGGKAKKARMSPENRTTLRRVLMFSQFQKKKPKDSQEVEDLKKELEKQKTESAKQQREMMDQMRQMKEMMQMMTTGGQPRDAAQMSNGNKSTDQPDGRNQSGAAPRADYDQIDTRLPEGNSQESEYQLKDAHVWKIAEKIPKEETYMSLGRALELDENALQSILTNNQNKINIAANAMLNKWRRTLSNAGEQGRVLAAALPEAGLADCVDILKS